MKLDILRKKEEAAGQKRDDVERPAKKARKTKEEKCPVARREPVSKIYSGFLGKGDRVPGPGGSLWLPIKAMSPPDVQEMNGQTVKAFLACFGKLFE